MNIELQKFLTDRTSFTAQQARQFGIHPSLLAYYVKQGLLERVSRGLYRNPAYDSQIPTPWEDLVATAQSIRNGVVCLISALNLYEVTDEYPREHWIAIPNDTWPKRRKHTRIVRMSNMTLGKVRMKMGQESIWVFDKERTVIDAFRLLSREIAIKALKHYLQANDDHQPDFKKLSKYAEKLRFDISPFVQALTT
jgi:predicted transcriptional regulator of viral defense system